MKTHEVADPKSKSHAIAHLRYAEVSKEAYL